MDRLGLHMARLMLQGQSLQTADVGLPVGRHSVHRWRRGTSNCYYKHMWSESGRGTYLIYFCLLYSQLFFSAIDLDSGPPDKQCGRLTFVLDVQPNNDANIAV